MGGTQVVRDFMSRGTSKTDTGRKPAYLRDVVERASGVVEKRLARSLQVRARDTWEGAQPKLVKRRLMISVGRC